jgi:hypothetical protein
MRTLLGEVDAQIYTYREGFTGGLRLSFALVYSLYHVC